MWRTRMKTQNDSGNTNDARLAIHPAMVTNVSQ